MKVLKIIGKLLATVVTFPFAVAGGLLCGLIIALCYCFILPLAVAVDIWEA